MNVTTWNTSLCFRAAAILCMAGLLLFHVGCAPGSEEMSPLDKACAYLWSKQAPDGGWHSETHAVLRDGRSLTPFILVALREAGTANDHQDDVERAIAFIRKDVHTAMDTDSVPMLLDYPNYAAAYALIALTNNGDPMDSSLINYLTAYLVEQQFDEDRGIGMHHPAFGAWGFGETNLDHGETGHVDISHTRRILEALRLVLPARHEVFVQAEQFLERIQNTGDDSPSGDGGFFASSVTHETNKSISRADIPGKWESYATATCDGLLALQAAGVLEDDTRIASAKQWLSNHQEMAFPEGIPTDDPAQWHRVMRFYHWSVRADVSHATSDWFHWQKDLTALAVAEQRADGSFMNPLGGPNKEDDPLLATALVVIALR